MEYNHNDYADLIGTRFLIVVVVFVFLVVGCTILWNIT